MPSKKQDRGMSTEPSKVAFSQGSAWNIFIPISFWPGLVWLAVDACHKPTVSTLFL